MRRSASSSDSSVANMLPKGSESLADRVLTGIRQSDPGERYSEEQWLALEVARPGIKHFIETASYELAPDDSELRAKLAEAMLALCQYLGESQLHEAVTAAFSKSLAEHFPSK